MDCILTLTDRDIEGTDGLSGTPPRVAARAVLLDEKGLMALLHIRKWGAYTLPGGGVEADETLEDALVRELREETGCQAVIQRPLGCVRENRSQHDFTQESYYYLAFVKGEKDALQLTPGEIEEGTEVIWLLPREALKRVAGAVHLVYQRKFI